MTLERTGYHRIDYNRTGGGTEHSVRARGGGAVTRMSGAQHEPRRQPPGRRVPVAAGRTLPLTTISPIAVGYTPLLRAVLQIMPTTPWGKSEDLQELSFIQSARWTILTGLPTSGNPVSLKYDYLLFETNFNGTEPAYLQAFTDILADRMRLIWNTSLGFPNFPEDEARSLWRRFRAPIPGRDFVAWVGESALPVGHHYSAYPEASNTEVLAGLQAERLLADLRGRAMAPEDAEGFAGAYADGLHRLQGRPELGRQPRDGRGDVRGQLYAFTCLTPLPANRLESLRATLADLPTGAESPFARLASVHFGRWIVVDSPPAQPGQRRDSWPTPYLLTTTTTDGARSPAADLYRHLGAARDAIFGHCLDYPADLGEDAFAAYLTRHQIRTTRFYAGYPYATVGQVRSGLDTHRRLLDFAADHLLDAPRDLLAAFRGDFVPGHPQNPEARR